MSLHTRYGHYKCLVAITEMSTGGDQRTEWILATLEQACAGEKQEYLRCVESNAKDIRQCLPAAEVLGKCVRQVAGRPGSKLTS